MLASPSIKTSFLILVGTLTINCRSCKDEVSARTCFSELVFSATRVLSVNKRVIRLESILPATTVTAIKNNPERSNAVEAILFLFTAVFSALDSKFAFLV